MEINRKQLLYLFIGVVLASALLGAGAALLVVKRHQASHPAAAGSTHYGSVKYDSSKKPVLLEATKSAKLTARAVCSSCSLGIPPKNEHHVYLVTEEPYRVFEVLPNEKATELLKITGSCAAGNYEITATGDVGVKDGKNTLLLSSFTAKEISQGSTTHDEHPH